MLPSVLSVSGTLVWCPCRPACPLSPVSPPCWCCDLHPCSLRTSHSPSPRGSVNTRVIRAGVSQSMWHWRKESGWLALPGMHPFIVMSKKSSDACAIGLAGCKIRCVCKCCPGVIQTAMLFCGSLLQRRRQCAVGVRAKGKLCDSANRDCSDAEKKEARPTHVSMGKCAANAARAVLNIALCP